MRTLRHPDFAADDIDTGFIDRHLSALTELASDRDALLQAVEFLLTERRCTERGPDPWNAQDGFRLSGGARERLMFTQGEKLFAIEIVHGRDGRVTVFSDGKAQTPCPLTDNAMRLASGEIAIMQAGDTYLFALRDPFESADDVGAASDRVIAPMSGRVIQVLVKVGDRVKRGSALAVLEAMKMEHTLSAPADATVAEVAVVAGEQVSEGAVMLKFETRDKA